MSKSNRTKVGLSVVSILLIALIASVGLLSGIYVGKTFFMHQSVDQSPIVGLNVGLKVTARHSNGQIFATRNLPHDLVLNNFNYMLEALLAPSSLGVSTSETNDAGTVNPLDLWTTTSHNFVSLYGCSGSCGGFIAIGTSAISPARSDYKLGTIFGSPQTNPAVSCTAGSTDSITYSDSFTITSSATISEAGSGIYQSSSGDRYYFFHDTFTGIAVSNGDVISIQYTISLNNSGFNVNLCDFLAALMSGGLGSSASSFTVYNTSGGAATFDTWCGGSGEFPLICTTGYASTSQSSFIAIGTGTAAYTPTTHTLTTQVGTGTITVTSYSSTNGEIYETTSITLSSSNTITEAGLFLTLSSANYLFSGATFSGQSETANQAFSISNEITD